METYSNENDQLEALKRFFASNGKVLGIGLILGIAALAAWRYWNASQQDTAREVSLAYADVISALKSEKPEAVSMASKFAADNKNSYGAFASLELAQHFVDKNDLPKAQQQLQQGVADAPDDNLRSIITLRLARVQLQLQKPDEALKSLDSIKGEAWRAAMADLRGEILLSKGDKQGARAAWEAGIASNSSPALNEMMRMKINNLAI